jgi:hypothetical protein
MVRKRQKGEPAFPRQTADLKEVCRVDRPLEAELIRNLLQSHGIRSLVRGRTAPFVYPLVEDGLAVFKIFVAAEDFPTARELLAGRPVPETESSGGKP